MRLASCEPRNGVAQPMPDRSARIGCHPTDGRTDWLRSVSPNRDRTDWQIVRGVRAFGGGWRTRRDLCVLAWSWPASWSRSAPFAGPVSLGQSLRCALSVPVDGLPREHLLVSRDDGRFVLHVPRGMTGRVGAAGALVEVASGQSVHDRARRAGQAGGRRRDDLVPGDRDTAGRAAAATPGVDSRHAADRIDPPARRDHRWLARRAHRARRVCVEHGSRRSPARRAAGRPVSRGHDRRAAARSRRAAAAHRSGAARRRDPGRT